MSIYVIFHGIVLLIVILSIFSRDGQRRNLNFSQLFLHRLKCLKDLDDSGSLYIKDISQQMQVHLQLA